MPPAESNSRGRRLLRWLERLLIFGGAAAITWCACVVANAYVVQRLGHDALTALPLTETLPSPGANVSSESSPTTSSPVPSGSFVAELSIPRVGMSAVVLQGTDDPTLGVGLGHFENTPLPGAAGNVAIAGHRDSFLRPLRNIRVGDDIWVDTIEYRVHYRVSWFRVVGPHEVSVVGPTEDAALTLVTCYPFGFIGRAPDRFIVRAARVGVERRDPAR